MPEKTICLFELFLIHSHNNNDNDLSLFSQSTSVCALSVFKDNTPPKKKKKNGIQKFITIKSYETCRYQWIRKG